MGNVLGCPGVCSTSFSRENSFSEPVFKKSDKSDEPWNLGVKMVRDDNYFDIGSLRLPTQLPTLLTAGQDPQLLKAVGGAADRLELGHTSLCTSEEVMASYKQERQSLVILELNPGHKYNPEAIVKYIRDSASGEECIIVGVLTRQTLEKNEGCVSTWLDLGVDQIACDSRSSVYWFNQLIQLLRGPLRQASLLLAVKLLATALDLSRDIVQITDSDNNIIWVNERAEKELGWFREELRGKNLSNLQTTGGTDSVSVENSTKSCDQWLLNRLKEGKNWEGPINSQRKTGDYIALASKVIPVTFSTFRKLDHILYIKHAAPSLSSPSILRNKRQASLRRPSVEIPPFYPEGRRKSSGKAHNVSMEAPITKVLNILLAAQENQPVYIAQALDKVVEILKSSASSELFNPEMQDKKKQDLVAKDLFSALLANSSIEPKNNQKRRSSYEKLISFNPRPSLPTSEVTPVQIGELLAASGDWGFDIIRLEEVTERRPLLWLGMSILSKFEASETLGVEENVLQNWLTLIESHYHSAIAYHNSTHAADVLQACAYFLEKSRVKNIMDSIDEIILLIGAIIHDVDHPGRNSAFLCNSKSELAILYNDSTVLENHHCALGYRLTVSHPSVNIFKNLDSETYTRVRKGLIDTVLATDMSKHFVHLNKFTTAVNLAQEEDNIDLFGQEVEEKVLIRRMLIKCADVSNPARPLYLCREWAIRIAEEYFSQTAEEKELGLPVVMPQFDRTSCSIPQSQIGFYEYFIVPMFEAWHGYTESPELVSHIDSNNAYWKERLAEEQATGQRITFPLREVRTTAVARLHTVKELGGDGGGLPSPALQMKPVHETILEEVKSVSDPLPPELPNYPAEIGVNGDSLYSDTSNVDSCNSTPEKSEKDIANIDYIPNLSQKDIAGQSDCVVYNSLEIAHKVSTSSLETVHQVSASSF